VIAVEVVGLLFVAIFCICAIADLSQRLIAVCIGVDAGNFAI